MDPPEKVCGIHCNFMGSMFFRKRFVGSTFVGSNVVEEGSKPNKKRKMPSKSGEGFNQGLKKFVGKCFNCGKSGH